MESRKITVTRAFPGGAVAETPPSTAGSVRLSPWLSKWVPTCLTVQLRNPRNQTKTKHSQGKSRSPLHDKGSAYGGWVFPHTSPRFENKVSKNSHEKRGAHRTPSNKKPEASAEGLVFLQVEPAEGASFISLFLVTSEKEVLPESLRGWEA